jgi:TatD DNase family protein
MKYFDAHCHVQYAPYDEDRDQVFARMRDADVGGILVGTDSAMSRDAVTLADGKTLFASVGLHPNDKPQEGYDDAFYESLVQDPKVVAIGECGLDYFRPDEPEKEKNRQKEVFAKHIELSGKTGKPLMIHARPSKGSMDAYLDAYEMLAEGKQRYPGLMGNMHFYVGDIETTKKYLELGFTFSYTAVLTFTKDYDEVVRFIPLDHLITETDSPFVAPAPNRGKRNEPTAVKDVVSAVARIRGEDAEAVREAVLANARRVFVLP